MSSTRLPRPNKDEYQKKMDEYSLQVKEIRQKLDLIQLPAKDLNSSKQLQKQEARTEFQTLLKQKQDLSAKKNTAFNQMKALQSTLKQKGDALRSEFDKLGFKNPQDCDAQISYYLLT